MKLRMKYKIEIQYAKTRDINIRTQIWNIDFFSITNVNEIEDRISDLKIWIFWINVY